MDKQETYDLADLMLLPPIPWCVFTLVALCLIIVSSAFPWPLVEKMGKISMTVGIVWYFGFVIYQMLFGPRPHTQKKPLSPTIVAAIIGAVAVVVAALIEILPWLFRR